MDRSEIYAVTTYIIYIIYIYIYITYIYIIHVYISVVRRVSLRIQEHIPNVYFSETEEIPS